MQDSEGCDACGEGGEPASLALALPMLVGTTTLVIQEISGAVVPDTSFLEPPTHVFGLEEVPVVVWLSQTGFFVADVVIVTPLLLPMAPSCLGVVAAVDPYRTALFPMEVAESQAQPSPVDVPSSSLGARLPT